VNYTENITYLANYAGSASYATDPAFLAQLPIFIESAEQRILRDMDLLSTRVSETGALTINQRAFILPNSGGTFNVVETVQLKMDVNGLLDGTQYTQPALQPVSIEFLNATYPDDHAIGAPSIPEYWAPYRENQIVVGRAPGQPYPIVIYGTMDPAPLSVSNTTTFISVNLPDLMLAAEMILVSAWEKQFSAMADVQGQARDWNQEYERLLQAANVQELRRFVESAGWSSWQPNPLNPPIS